MSFKSSMLHTGYNTNMQEEWRWVVGYEGYYEVSNLGNVKSIKRNGTNGGILKPAIVRRYYSVVLKTPSDRKMKKVHRLVAQAFIPNPDNKPQINHIDNKCLNNVVTNLEWVTSLENNQHMTRQGRGRYPGAWSKFKKLNQTGAT